MPNRREVLTAAAAVVAAASLEAFAAPPPTKPVADTSRPGAAVAEAAAMCAAVGKACLDHCIRQLSTGDKMMAECAGTVRQMIPLCEATAELARQGSSHAKALAAVCARACRECEAACKKHAGHHAECKACMDSCARCATECEKFSA